MKKLPIIMDVDTGVDDAMAIMLALASDKLNVLGITTVAGNQTLEKTTTNTLAVLELVGRTEVPVAAGAATPLMIPLHTAPEVHGNTGLGNAVLPAPKKKVEPIGAVDLICKLLEESAEPVTLVPVGPLTNIATFLLACPHLKSKVKEIIIMGGGAYRGNSTTVAEFNIIVDPEAARIVLDAGIPLVICGLDVTMKALVAEHEIETFRQLGTPAGIFCADAFSFYANAYRRYEEMEGGCAVHDAVAICCLINPEILKGQKGNITVDLDGKYTRGCTTTDLRTYIPEKSRNATVMLDIDRERFVQILLDAVK